jgi:hypothetical protein
VVRRHRPLLLRAVGGLASGSLGSRRAAGRRQTGPSDSLRMGVQRHTRPRRLGASARGLPPPWHQRSRVHRPEVGRVHLVLDGFAPCLAVPGGVWTQRDGQAARRRALLLMVTAGQHHAAGAVSREEEFVFQEILGRPQSAFQWLRMPRLTRRPWLGCNNCSAARGLLGLNKISQTCEGLHFLRAGSGMTLTWVSAKSNYRVIQFEPHSR